MKKFSFSRSKVLAVFLSLFALVICYQMIRIQNSSEAEYLDKWAKNYGYEVRTIQSERGYIYDRWGNLLAGNKEVYEVGIELQFVRNPAAIASTMSNLLELDYGFVFKAANTPYVPGETVYMTLVDFVSYEKIKELSALKTRYENQNPYGDDPNKPSLRGLVWSPHLQRAYPEHDLASNVLGFYTFYNREGGTGSYGVEQYYDSLLAGIKQNVVISLDPYELQEIPTAPAGASLILTIDREIQRSVEKILDQAVTGSKSVSGTIIIMNPENGEILALANSPRLDPNAYWEIADLFPDVTAINKSVTQVYEPGSVFKVLTMAAALDAGVVTPETTYTDYGVYEVGPWEIFNWDRGAWGEQTMVGCMQHSLNVCLATVAEWLNQDRFYSYMERFGIGHRTNIDMAGEVVFPLIVPGDQNWNIVNLATNSFGQGLAVTPMQMVMAVSSIANDGKMMAPHILKAYIQDGQQYDTVPQVMGQPISAETAHTLTEMLATSLEEEASDALVEGYRVAGKTGTGEIAVNGMYTSYLTNASFVGWGPIEDPKFVVYIWLEKPRTSIWGSVVAAPVFSDVVEELVVLMDIPPDDVRVGMTKE